MKPISPLCNKTLHNIILLPCALQVGWCVLPFSSKCNNPAKLYPEIKVLWAFANCSLFFYVNFGVMASSSLCCIYFQNVAVCFTMDNNTLLVASASIFTRSFAFGLMCLHQKMFISGAQSGTFGHLETVGPDLLWPTIWFMTSCMIIFFISI